MNHFFSHICCDWNCLHLVRLLVCQSLLDGGDLDWRAIFGQDISKPRKEIIAVLHLFQLVAIDRDDERRAIVNDYTALRIENSTTRGFSGNRSRSVRSGLHRKLGSFQHLQIPKPSEERDETRSDHNTKEAHSKAR